MEEAGEEPFRVSQVEIFIKFEFFKKRIEKVNLRKLKRL